MSDNSAPIYVDDSFSSSGVNVRRYSFRYSSTTPGQHLVVKWWDAAGANITLNAATLSYGSVSLNVGSGQQISWPVGMLLQEAPFVTGPWTANPGPWATNGTTASYHFTPAGSQKFFRAIVQ